jgi:hypothetical protein
MRMDHLRSLWLELGGGPDEADGTRPLRRPAARSTRPVPLKTSPPKAPLLLRTVPLKAPAAQDGVAEGICCQGLAAEGAGADRFCGGGSPRTTTKARIQTPRHSSSSITADLYTTVRAGVGARACGGERRDGAAGGP